MSACSSLRAIAWQHHVTGSLPAAMTEKFFSHAYAAASSVVLVLRDPTPESLAMATWGLSHFARRHNDDRRITLLVPRAPPPECPGSPPPWIQSRLGWLGHLLREKQLLVRAYDLADLPAPRCLPELFQIGRSLVLAVEKGSTPQLQDGIAWALGDESPGVAADFVWSYGDPLRRMQSLSAFCAVAETSGQTELADHWARFLESFDSGAPEDWAELYPAVEVTTESDRPLYAHQSAAIQAWLANDGRGIFQFCTGGGKTVAALRAIKALSATPGFSKGPVVVTVPTRILGDQWQREIQREGFARPLEAYNNRVDWLDYLEPYLVSDDQPRFVVTTYTTFVSALFQNILKGLGGDVRAVWIADEVHNISSATRLNAMEATSAIFRYRLGLSATPEVEDDANATTRILRFFDKVLTSYDLKDGIREKVLCPYRYYPQPIFLSPEIGLRYLDNLRRLESSPNLVDLYRQNKELVRTSGVQLSAFNDILDALPGDFSHTLVYCPPGYGGRRVEQDEDGCQESDLPQSDDRRLVEQVVVRLQGRDVPVCTILGDTLQQERVDILQRFRTGRVRAVCAIGCLDEGVDVPSITRAIILYSHDSLKQFIQRRGRILRRDGRDEGKVAEIRDVLVLPHGVNMPQDIKDRLLRRELRRYQEFAALALNRDEAADVLNKALNHARGDHE